MIKIIDGHTVKLIKQLEIDFIDIININVKKQKDIDKKIKLLEIRLKSRSFFDFFITIEHTKKVLSDFLLFLETTIKDFPELEKELIEIKDKAESYLTCIKLADSISIRVDY